MRAQLESAEAAHLLAAVLLVPYIGYACVGGWWEAVAWLVLYKLASMCIRYSTCVGCAFVSIGLKIGSLGFEPVRERSTSGEGNRFWEGVSHNSITDSMTRRTLVGY
jgi:hypothetical protein